MLNPTDNEDTICVIGGGIIGLFTALELQSRGYEVILLEKGEIGGRQAASFGNGCWINPGAIMPISLPGLWRKVPGMLLDPNGPFSIRWQYLPRLANWLIRFVWAGRSWKEIDDLIQKRLPLLRDAVTSYTRYAVEAGVPDLVRKAGVMYIYRTQDDLDHDRLDWERREKNGIELEYLDTEELHRIEPDISQEYKFAVRMKNAATLADPGAYCAALGKYFQTKGGKVIQGTALDFILSNGKLSAIRTEDGDIQCGKAVISAGIWSKELARKLGDRLPLVSERGYHITIAQPEAEIHHGLMPGDGKMAIVQTRSGLRLAGQVELSDVNAKPKWERAYIQLEHALRLFPQMREQIKNGQHDVWMGHRPSTPDSLPVISTSRATSDIIYAFGHGHTGVSMAPATAELVADIIGGDMDAQARAKPYSVGRF